MLFDPDYSWGGREDWSPGDQAHFEYHCLESSESSDAEIWYRSHQLVTVLGVVEGTEYPGTDHPCRAEGAIPRVYRVQWNEDGFTGEVFEDELLVSPNHFCRPDPIKPDEG